MNYFVIHSFIIPIVTLPHTIHYLSSLLGNATNNPTTTTPAYDTNGGSDPRLNQSKLRESLIRATGELSQFSRKNQLLEEKVQELSLNLKKSKQENHNLQTEVNAMRSLGFTSTPRGEENYEGNNGNNNNTNGISGDGTIPKTTLTEKFVVKKKGFDILDQKLQVLLTRQNISTEDGILMLRRIVNHLSSLSFISTVPEAAKMMTSKAVLQIFDVEVITFFVAPFIEMPQSQLFHKYSSEVLISSSLSVCVRVGWLTIKINHCDSILLVKIICYYLTESG